MYKKGQLLKCVYVDKDSCCGAYYDIGSFHVQHNDSENIIIYDTIDEIEQEYPHDSKFIKFEVYDIKNTVAFRQGFREGHGIGYDEATLEYVDPYFEGCVYALEWAKENLDCTQEQLELLNRKLSSYEDEVSYKTLDR